MPSAQLSWTVDTNPGPHWHPLLTCLPGSMVLSIRYVAVAITAILHATSGILLSILALSLQGLFPSLKQLPPSFVNISDVADSPQQHFPSRRDSGYSISTVTSEDHFTLLLASQARARAARTSSFTLSASLWTLKECPSPKPSQLGEERGATTFSDVPPGVLTDSPSTASSRLSMPPQERKVPEAPRPGLKQPQLNRSHSSHCLPLLPLNRKGLRAPSSPVPGLLRRKSSSSPHLREAAALSRKRSSSGDHSRSHTSISEQARKIVTIASLPKSKDGKRKSEKNGPSKSAPRVDRERTDPYHAPYFFPSPVSPLARDYMRLAMLDRNLISGGASPSTPMSPEDGGRHPSSWSGERMRSLWVPLHRKSLTHKQI
ncbi:hypothetical protein BC827DRAFT_1189292 [Russula dissimulans]|nr:hypothetical protein BC827DRAFT_1189292 [Russula dissimulans]